MGTIIILIHVKTFKTIYTGKYKNDQLLIISSLIKYLVIQTIGFR